MTKSMTSSSFKKVVRMWHDIDGEWCHAWDVEENAFKQWIQGEVPLSAFAVLLPSGEHPKVSSRVQCGTCLSVRITPKLMKHEIVHV